MDGLSAPSKKRVKKKIKTIKSKQENMSDKKNAFSLVFTMLITALIVGGGIYAWQDRVNDSSLSKIKTDARNTREGFERSLKNLENKVRKVEDENNQLSAENNELKDKAELIKGALKKYQNNELSLSFSYPAIMGDISYEKTTGSVGEKYFFSFSRNPSFHISGVSDGYKELVEASSSEVNFDNFFQLEKKKDKYKAFFFLNGEKEEYDLNPIEVISFSDGEALLVDSKSFVLKDGQAPLNIGQNLGAIFSVGDGGLAMLNSDFGQLSPDDFKELLRSIKIK